MQLHTFKEMANCGLVEKVTVIARPTGFSLLVKHGDNEEMVRGQLGPVREFVRLDTVRKNLTSVGISSYEIVEQE